MCDIIGFGPFISVGAAVVIYLINRTMQHTNRSVHETQQAKVSGSIFGQGNAVIPFSTSHNKASQLSSSFASISSTLPYTGQVSQRIANAQSDEDTMLNEKVKEYEEENAELLSRFQSLRDEIRAKKINSFDALAAQDKKATQLLIQLARRTQPMVLEGKNIGIFGLTSAGKSTLLNAIMGKKVAETGVGETTTQITPYPSERFILWDVPGRNDEVIYLGMEYISFFKGLTRRLILITSTVKENSSIMHLLDEIDLEYDIVVNKFDLLDEDEQQEHKDQIKSEIEKLKLKKINRIFYVSAKQPDMFPDWMEMVNSLTN